MQNGVDVLLCGNLQQYLILSKLFNDFSTIPVTPLEALSPVSPEIQHTKTNTGFFLKRVGTLCTNHLPNSFFPTGQDLEEAGDLQ